jgi:hypothetical protein
MSFRFNGASCPISGSAASGSAKITPRLMVSFYVKAEFAKMTALPDNLTETPESFA